MNRKEAIKLLTDLNNYLEYNIGIGSMFGVLGHDAGGVLSHSVLHNDPNCYELNSDGSRKTCQLNEDDKSAVTDVYNDLCEIIKEGNKKQYCKKINDLINFLKTSDILKI